MGALFSMLEGIIGAEIDILEDKLRGNDYSYSSFSKDYHIAWRGEIDMEDVDEKYGQLVEDLNECIDDWTQKLEEKHEYDEVYEDRDLGYISADQDQSAEFIYPTKAKAKVACKNAVQAMLDDAELTYMKEKDIIINECRQYLEQFYEEISQLTDIVKESFKDFVSVDLDDEGLSELLKDTIDMKFSEENVGFEFEEMENRFDHVVKVIFSDPAVGLFDLKEYFDLCDYDECDDEYCYLLNDAESTLNEKLSDFWEDANDQIKDIKEDIGICMAYELGRRLKTIIHDMLQEIS